jgi:urease accessory protein
LIVDRSRKGHDPASAGTALVFARRGARTVLAHSRVCAPMTLIRPFPLASGRLIVQLITLGPGLCGGDQIEVDIVAEHGADVVVTTTAATRVLSMQPGLHAEQRVRITADEGATVQYYPLVTIPFPESAFTQAINVHAASRSRVGVLETWAMGRTARGEYLRFRSLSSRTNLLVDGTLCYADATELQPGEPSLAGAGVLAGRRYVASGVWYGATLAQTAQDGAHTGDVLVALAQARPDIVFLRALASDAPALEAALRDATDRVAAAWQSEPVVLDRFRN